MVVILRNAMFYSILFILDNDDPNFSLFQSNILFGLYFLGSVSVLTADVAIMITRAESSEFTYGSCITASIVVIFLFNTILWLDLNYLFYKI